MGLRFMVLTLDAHEELVDLGKFADDSGILSNEFPDGLVIAEIPNVTEHWHQTFGSDGEAIHIQFGSTGSISWSTEYAFVVVSHDMTCSRWDCKELEGTIFD